jgi:hypothetical protein
MPHLLHLLTDPTDAAALDVITRQAADPALRLSVVLLDEATRLLSPLPGRVYRLDTGHGVAPPDSPHITHAALLDLIFDADAVVTW